MCGFQLCSTHKYRVRKSLVAIIKIVRENSPGKRPEISHLFYFTGLGHVVGFAYKWKLRSRSFIYKTSFNLANLYRTLKAPMLKSNHCTAPGHDCHDSSLQRIGGSTMRNRAKFALTLTKSIFAAIVMIGILSLGAQTASAQSVNVTAPFSFVAGSQSYPAGTYEFTLISEWCLSIRNMSGGGEKFFTILPSDDNKMQQSGGLSFRNTNGQKVLLAVYVPGSERAAVLTEAVRNFKGKAPASETEISVVPGKAARKQVAAGR
jgi:hypothetical protein